MEAALEAWISSFSYPAVFVLLLLAGMGAPLSEDLILVLAGVVVARYGGHLAAMVATAYVGVLSGDVILHRVGRKWGPKVTELRPFRRLLTPKRIAWAEEHFRKRGVLTVFVARHLAGLRAPTFLVSGMSAMSTRKFVAVDALAALITVPLTTYLGYRFGKAVLAEIEHFSTYLFAGVGAAVVVALGYRALRKRQLAKRSLAS